MEKEKILALDANKKSGEQTPGHAAQEPGARSSEAILADYRNNEAVVNEALRRSLTKASPDEGIEELLRYLGEALPGERVYIFEKNDHGGFDNTYEWCAAGVTPQKENLQNLGYDVLEIWEEEFREKESVIIRELEEIRESDPKMYDCLKPQQIHSLVAGPLYQDEQGLVSFFGVDNPEADRLSNISLLFQILGHFLVSLLRWRDLVSRLEVMSYRDQLTGCGNRHAVSKYAQALKPDESIGMLYADVTGLKRLNDTEGHKAGDALLVRAAQCLQAAFGERAVFRIGGDEFLALCAGITEAELGRRVERLQQEMAARNVLLAMGSVWRPDSCEPIDKLLKQADQRMYENKRDYYTAANDRRGAR
jgi:diguanylate cyclase (GGDEF)-like protein